MDHPPREHALTGAKGPLIPDGLDATLVLVRHGESTFIVEERFQGRAETPLSPTGLRQAGLVARRLAHAQDAPTLPVPGDPPIELVHSPLQRTSQTAEAIEDAFRGAGMAVARRADGAFLEIGQGAWEGLHRSEIDARYAEVLSAWRHRPLEAWAPGGESLPEVQARVRPGLASVLVRLSESGRPGSLDRPQVAGYRDAAINHPWSVVVGHDGVFKVALLTLFDLPLDRFWMWSMDLCGLSVIEFRGGRPVLRAHNLTAHLADLLDEQAQTELDERSRSGAL
ncbi:MAG TPA: histidine phosphatase family protein [Candidatus Limnocylindrales bacterium]|nr:histidine phosphatase family protein [Candidatus Limnocylindrales bacterium]